MANPAAVYAIKKGKEYRIKTDKQGNKYGVVVLRSGREVDAWDYYKSRTNISSIRKRLSKTSKLKRTSTKLRRKQQSSKKKKPTRRSRRIIYNRRMF